MPSKSVSDSNPIRIINVANLTKSGFYRISELELWMVVVYNFCKNCSFVFGKYCWLASCRSRIHCPAEGDWWPHEIVFWVEWCEKPLETRQEVSVMYRSLQASETPSMTLTRVQTKTAFKICRILSFQGKQIVFIIIMLIENKSNLQSVGLT